MLIQSRREIILKVRCVECGKVMEIPHPNNMDFKDFKCKECKKEGYWEL